jgi:hypothetical protein
MSGQLPLDGRRGSRCSHDETVAALLVSWLVSVRVGKRELRRRHPVPMTREAAN